MKIERHRIARITPPPSPPCKAFRATEAPLNKGTLATMRSLIAVIDIGKTNAKLLLMSASDGSTVWLTERISPAVPSRYAQTDGLLDRELDVHGMKSWLLAQFAALPGKERIHAIVPVAHGAAMVLVDEAGGVLAAPDYEDRHFDSLRAEYMSLRNPFARTFSPFLPSGLNLGSQIFYLQRAGPLSWRARLILTYPQYWSWRLSGVAASEVTSLGCHSDLWCPIEGRFSDLAITSGWASLMPPLRPAYAVLGTLRQEVVTATGLSAGCAVVCGIHQFQSLLPFPSYLHERRGNIRRDLQRNLVRRPRPWRRPGASVRRGRRYAGQRRRAGLAGPDGPVHGWP